MRALILTMCILLNLAPAESATHLIGLGRDCQVVNYLVHLKLRNAAYPFDWVTSYNFYGVMQAIEDDFKYFLDPACLVYKTSFIENTYYNFGFKHFFPIVGQPPIGEEFLGKLIVPNFLDYLPMVQETQNRRIQRFCDLASSNEQIIFLRTHSVPKEAADFMNMIKSKYPQINATLVVIHDRTDLIGNWNIPNVLSFYATKRCGFGDWWTANEWSSVFFKIHHWLTTGQVL